MTDNFCFPAFDLYIWSNRSSIIQISDNLDGSYSCFFMKVKQISCSAEFRVGLFICGLEFKRTYNLLTMHQYLRILIEWILKETLKDNWKNMYFDV